MALHRFRDLDGNHLKIQLPLAGLASQVFLGTGIADLRFDGAVNSIAHVVSSIATGALRAYPVFVPRTCRFDRIQCELVTGAAAGGVIRFGVYASESETNPKPTRLLYGSASTATDVAPAVLSETPSAPVNLPGPAIYWLANLTGTAAPGMRALAQAAVLPLLGWPAAGGSAQQTLLARTFAFAALPNPFGTPTSIGTGNPTAVGLRLIA